MPPDWERVKAVFEQAMELPRAQRDLLLETACSGLPGLRTEVLSLLEAHDRAGAFLDTASASAPLEQTRVGQRLGPYLLASELGRGGMGVVYLARREAPAREVAIKVLAGPGSELIERFRAESQILARLDHPHVARLFDVGRADDGQPYFVMELVRGVPIDRYCDQAGLDAAGRLRLFLKVCDAVAYAHARLVVHRDIKPANVLVDGEGQPRLLDFGIARLLDDGLAGSATATGMRLMTPEFASPEQVRGEPATVATDVHALGLLLYLLLTGRNPFSLRSTSPAELVRVVCVEDPPRPSALVTASPAGSEAQAAEARRLRLLRGDLDAIVARALRKEPQHRYASVAALADDVGAHLAGRPVQARGGRWRYRLGKFVGRHRLPVALGVALLVALVGGLLATLWQAHRAQIERARAEKRFADVRRLATGFLFDFHDAIADLPGSTRARALVVRKALEYLDGLSQEAEHDPQLQLELVQAYQRLGKVQGIGGSPNLGEVNAARQSLEKAHALLARVGKGERTPAYEAARLDVLVDLARAHGQLGDFDRSLALLREAVSDLATTLPADATPESARIQAFPFRDLAFELQRRGELAAAEQAAHTALSLAREAGARWPQDPATLRLLTYNHRALAAIQAQRGKLAEARTNARSGLAAARAAFEKGDTRSERALVHALLSMADVEGDVAGAAAAYAEALGLVEEQARDDPNDTQAPQDVAVVLGQWCERLNRDRVLTRPRDVCAESARALQAVLDPADVWTVFNAAMGPYNLGLEAELQGEPRRAVKLYDAALRGLTAPALAGSGQEVSNFRAQILGAQARGFWALRQPVAAADAARRGLQELGELVSGRGANLDLLELRVQLHVGLARRPSGKPLCPELEAGRAAAELMRPLLSQAPRLAATLEEFDNLCQECAR